MPYIYPAAATLERKPKVGTTDCVALAQYYARAPNTQMWREGKPVLNNPDIVPGTAIATFVKGRYPSHKHGNHAAFFLRHDAPGRGFWIIDQWDDTSGHRGTKRYISARPIYVKNGDKRADGTWPEASDNANAFSIIE